MDQTKPMDAKQALAEIATEREHLSRLEREYSAAAAPPVTAARARLARLEAAYSQPGSTLPDLKGMTTEQVADAHATDAGRRTIGATLSGHRDVRTLDVSDPATLAGLTPSESAHLWEAGRFTPGGTPK